MLSCRKWEKYTQDVFGCCIWKHSTVRYGVLHSQNSIFKNPMNPSLKKQQNPATNELSKRPWLCSPPPGVT